MKSTLPNHVLCVCFSLVVAGTGLFASPAYAAQPSSARLPQTTALEKDLNDSRQSLISTRNRQTRLQRSSADTRKKLQGVRSLISSLRSVESKIKRIERELKSLTKVPQLKMFKPVVKGLAGLRGKVASARTKADKFRRNVLDPNISRLKKFEQQVARTVSKLRALESQVVQAQQNVGHMKQFARSNSQRPGVIASTEQMAAAGRAGIRPLKTGLADIDSSGRQLEGQLRSYSSSVDQVVRLKSGISKLNGQLAPIDRKAKAVAKVMNKRLEFKVPITRKRISISVRNVLEAPDRIIGVAAKPLTKLASKALSPLTKKVQFNLKAPKELAQISQKLDQLSRMKLDVQRVESRLRKATDAQLFRQVESALRRLTSSGVPRIG